MVSYDVKQIQMMTFSPCTGSVTGSSTTFCFKKTLPLVARNRILSKAIDLSLGTRPLTNPSLTCFDRSVVISQKHEGRECPICYHIMQYNIQSNAYQNRKLNNNWVPVLIKEDCPLILQQGDFLQNLSVELQRCFEHVGKSYQPEITKKHSLIFNTLWD